MTVWRRMAESGPWDTWTDLITIQALAPGFLETEAGEGMFELVRDITALMDPFTVRAACLAMEKMDLSPLVPKIAKPLLMTNGRHDIICPPSMAPSGLGAVQMAEMNPNVTAYVFEEIAHADLVECPDEAVDVVHAFFQKHGS
jgi:pimeloyl-ACP methyl ester carboxylesterase